jgi:hypothetical protein
MKKIIFCVLSLLASNCSIGALGVEASLQKLSDPILAELSTIPADQIKACNQWSETQLRAHIMLLEMILIYREKTEGVTEGGVVAPAEIRALVSHYVEARGKGGKAAPLQRCTFDHLHEGYNAGWDYRENPSDENYYNFALHYAFIWTFHGQKCANQFAEGIYQGSSGKIDWRPK